MKARTPLFPILGLLAMGLASTLGQDGAEPAQLPSPEVSPEEAAATEPDIAPPRDEDLVKLLAGLSAESFAVREKAHGALNQFAKHHPAPIKEALVGTYLSTEDEEVRYRLEAVLFEAVKAEFRGRPRGFLGIQMTAGLVQDGAQPRGSIQIERVIPDTGAARAGLQRGDNIIAVDDVTFEALTAPARRSITNENTSKFKQYIESKQEGDQVKVKVRRQREDLTFTVRLGDFPEYLRSDDLLEEEKHFDTWLESKRESGSEAP